MCKLGFSGDLYRWRNINRSLTKITSWDMSEIETVSEQLFDRKVLRLTPSSDIWSEIAILISGEPWQDLQKWIDWWFPSELEHSLARDVKLVSSNFLRGCASIGAGNGNRRGLTRWSLEDSISIAFKRVRANGKSEKLWEWRLTLTLARNSH
jgi:hypothetical protein